MKRFKVIALGLALVLACLATAPRLASADDACCVSAQQEVENACARMGTWVRYFSCDPCYPGALCAYSWDCYPPAQ